MSMICRNCHAENPESAKFCNQCGTKLETPSEQSSAAPERRQLTVVFSDLIGSTQLAEKLDPEDMRNVLKDYQSLCTRIVGLYDGYLSKFMGDGMLAYFGYPTAHEDDARRAIQAGLGIIEGMKTLSENHLKKTGVPIDVRVGIHTGLVVAGDMDKDQLEINAIVGQTPNVAARIQTAAEPNTLLISGDTYKLVRGFFETTDLGAHELKGISTAVHLYRVDHASTARSRLEAIGDLTPFAGRQAEIHTLETAWHRTQEGTTQTVMLCGEPGVGKSRLTHWLKQYAANDPDSWLSELQCSPYHLNSSFYPVIDFLERYPLRYERGESNEEKLTKIEGFLLQYGFDLAQNVPLLASLLSVPLPEGYERLNLTPLRQKQLTIELLVSILLHRAAVQPLLFVLEDVHWADPSTLELIDQLLARAPGNRLLILMTFRPQFVPYWKDAASFTRIDIAGLPTENAAEIIRRVANNKELPKDVVQFIITKTDGIPLFLEELTKTILEADILIDKGSWYELSVPLEKLGIPTTIQDSLTARLDRIPEAKAVAQAAAVIGREFSYDLLSKVAGGDDTNIRLRLDQLENAGLLFKREGGENPTYLFKHALVQDSAYSSLLKTTRKTYHQTIAETLETTSPHLIETQPELLAHHFSNANITLKAIQYWISAGIRALQRSANAEAVSHLQHALEQTAQLDDPLQRNGFDLQIYTAMGPALFSLKGFGVPEVGENYKKAAELSELLGEGPHLFAPLWGQWIYNQITGKLRHAYDITQRLEKLGTDLSDPAMLVEAYWTQGNSLLWIGDVINSIRVVEKTFTIYDPAKHHINAYLYGQDPCVAAHCVRVFSYWVHGKPDTALKASDESIALAEQLKHPFSIGWAYGHRHTLSMLNRDYAETVRHTTRTIQYCTDQAYPYWLLSATVMLGWALVHLGKHDEGLATLEQGLAGWQMIGSTMNRCDMLQYYAEALNVIGDHHKAYEKITEAIQSAEEIEQIISIPDNYRVKGEVLHKLRKYDEAEDAFRYSREHAHARQAFSHHLKATTSYYELLQTLQREDEGRDLIRESLAHITEGTELPYIARARNFIT